MPRTSDQSRFGVDGLWWVRILLGVVILIGISRVAIPLFEPLLAGSVGKMEWGWLAFAGMLCLIYRLLNAAAWGGVLRAVGQPIGARLAARMWIRAEACRWLPGSLWSYGSRMVLSTRAGIPSLIVGAAMALELALTLSSWAVLGIVGGLICGLAVDLPVRLPVLLLILSSFLTVVVLLTLVPRKQDWLCNKLQGVSRRFCLLGQVRPRARIAGSVFVLYSLLGLFNGLAFWLVLQGIAPEANVPLLAAIAANALAWLIGFLAIFAPAGLGVREGVLVLLLAPWLPWELGMVAAGCWRLLQIASELGCLGLVWKAPAKMESSCEIPANQSRLGEPSMIAPPA